MNSPDEAMLDKRPVYRVHYLKLLKWFDLIRKIGKGDPLWNDEAARRVTYVEEVVMFGNCGSRENTIDLPTPFSLADIEAVIGGDADGQPEAGSAASWKRVRARFDAMQSGRGGRVK